MDHSSKICGVCFKPNGPSLAACRRCHNPLTETASEEQVKEYYKKKGLPAGVLIFTALASIGFFVSFPPLISAVPLSEFSPFDWLQIFGMNLALLVLTAGLLVSREWARKGIIFFEIAAIVFGILTLFSIQSHKGPNYEIAFERYAAAQHAEAEAARRRPFTEEELRREFHAKMDLSESGGWVPMLLMTMIAPAIWFAYFSGPVKRYFYYKELIRADAARGKP